MKYNAVDMSLLYDYYGELLTEKQRDYFENYFHEDLTLAEIAENEGVSRQGVHDSISRAESALLLFEEKTGCVRRAGRLSQAAQALETVAAALETRDPELAAQVRAAQALLKE